MADEEVSLRTATPEDAAGLLALLKQLRTETTTFQTDGQLDQLSATDEATQLAAIERRLDALVAVATYGDDLIGVLTMQPRHTDGVVELGVAVLKEFWNFGIGSELVDLGLEWATETESVHEVVLTVYKRNEAAIHVYQSLGFSTEVRPEVPEDEWFMKLDV